LIDLFTTIGPVKRAEIQYESSGRSRGTGVVEFDTAENAETSIRTLNLVLARLE
jgi:RNA recognition motif-containing protein